MQRKLTKNKTCKHCKTKFDQVRFGQVACGIGCAVAYSKGLEQKKVNARARNKRKDYPNVYIKENKKDLQDTVQEIVRLIDKGASCIDCDRMIGKPCFDGGHYKSKGSNATISLNLHNIFKQTRGCNHQGQTSPEAFMVGIKKMYGNEYGDFVESLALLYPYLGLSSKQYPELTAEARKIARELKKLDLEYTPKQRMRLREKYNDRLGIYKIESL